MDQHEQVLSDLYYKSEHGYSSPRRLYLEAKKVLPQLLQRQVREWLEAQDVYTLHKPANRRLRAEPRVYVKGIDRQWAMDLCDMGNISAYNDGVRYMLTCIDVFSKFAWAVPVKNKQGTMVADAFRKILQATDRRPTRIETDKGKEFYNRVFRGLTEEIGASHFSSNSRHKSATVERFNRTLKSLLYKMFTKKRTLRWLDQLDVAMRMYNGRFHRSIKMKPKDVSHMNERKVYRTLYKKLPRPGRLFQVGSLVRVSKVKSTFEKGYLANYTDEVFQVIRVHPGRPNQYTLSDLMGEELEGKFVSEELSVVRKDPESVWLVEKVIKRNRNGQYLVKWLGFPPKFNSWVDSIEVT